MRDGAAVIFLRDGYAGASVDDITREARVSKATLYSYFPEKSMMFHAAMQAELSDAFSKCPFNERTDGNAANILPKLLIAIADWAAAEQQVRLVRIVIAEGVRFPNIVVLYDRALARCIIDPLKALLDVWIDQNQINRHDSDHSARQLVAMVIGQVQQRTMLTGLKFTKMQLEECAQATAHLFLSSYATDEEQTSLDN